MFREIEEKEEFNLEFCIGVYEEPTDGTIKDIFAEEKQKAGLENTKIYLFIPEEKEAASNDFGNVRRDEDKTYSIRMWPRLHKTDAETRNTIRHELAHIKFGDCDRKLPWPLNRLYTWLVEEPRAIWYANNS